MTDFDDHERQRWAGQARAYERSFAPLCAHPAGPLLDAAGVAAGDRVLDIGTGTGTVAALAATRGGQVVAIDAAPSSSCGEGEIFDAAGAERPPVPRLAAALDFPRTAAGLAGLLRDAGLTGVRCTEPAWTHRTDPEDWWSGPANGVATPGLVLEHQPQHRIAGIRAVFDRLTAPYRDSGGRLALPTSALLAVGTV